MVLLGLKTIKTFKIGKVYCFLQRYAPTNGTVWKLRYPNGIYYKRNGLYFVSHFLGIILEIRAQNG